MKITREQLRRWGACYADERIAELVPEDGLTPTEIAALDIPAGDRLWVLLREDLIPERELRLLACGWAEAACLKAGWNDARSLAAIAVARRFACGDASAAETKAAARAAWAAASADRAITSVDRAAASAAAATESDRAKAAAAVSAAAAASASSVAAALAAARSAEAATRSAEVAARSAAEAESDRAAAAAAALAAARAEQLADVVKILHRRFRATTNKGIT